MGSFLSKDRSDRKERFRCLEMKVGKLESTTESVVQDVNILKWNILQGLKIGGTGVSLDTSDDSLSSAPETVGKKRKRRCHSALENALVLQGILGSLDHTSLLDARLVSQTWNTIAIPILGKTSKVVCTPEKMETISDIDSVLSNAPPGLFQEVWLKTKYLAQPECQVLLADYGPKLKTLHMLNSGPLDLLDLHSILASWCPSLERLEYDEIGIPETDIEGIRNNFNFPQPLNLRQVSLAGTNPDSRRDGFSVDPLVRILKSSPKLDRVKLCLGYVEFEKVLSEVKGHPNVSRNWRSLRIETFYRTFNPLPTVPIHSLPYLPLMGIAFERLTLLTLHSSIPLKYLPKLFEKVKGTLETVILLDYDCEIDLIQQLSFPDVPCPLVTFPKMERLRTFKNLSNSTFPMRSIRFVSCFENLETLLLSGSERLADRQIDALFKYCEDLEANPHKNLRSLTLHGKICSVKTLQSMRKVFPQVQTLHVELGSGESDRDILPVKRNWFKEALRQISMFTGLKTLHIHFKKSLHLESDGFLYFRSLKDLENLTLERWFQSTMHTFDSGFEEKLVRIPSLRSVTLIGFSMTLTDAKMLIDSMEENGIYLELNEVYERPRIHPEFY